MRQESLLFVLVAALVGATAGAQPAWVERLPGGCPAARYNYAMAYSGAAGTSVLFGGNTFTADTWTWDGRIWRMLPSSQPSPRTGHAMAYDSTRGVTVLYGGTGEQVVHDDTWEWDGTTWTQLSPTSDPANLIRVQAVVPDDSANARGITLSNAVDVVLGLK